MRPAFYIFPYSLAEMLAPGGILPDNAGTGVGFAEREQEGFVCTSSASLRVPLALLRLLLWPQSVRVFPAGRRSGWVLRVSAWHNFCMLSGWQAWNGPKPGAGKPPQAGLRPSPPSRTAGRCRKAEPPAMPQTAPRNPDRQICRAGTALSDGFSEDITSKTAAVNGALA